MASDPSRRDLLLAFGLGRALAWLLVPVAPLAALEPAHHVTQYGHTAWTVQDGRLPGAVFAMTQTVEGGLWVGTEFGLFRFDGVTFSPWQPPAGQHLPSQAISALAPAPDGGLWIGTPEGVSYWKGQELKVYKASQSSVTSVLVDRGGTVWVGTAGFNSGGLCRVQGDRLACYTSADGYDGGGVLALFEDGANHVWIGSAGGLYRFDSGKFRRYGTRNDTQAITSTTDGGIVIAPESGLEKLVGGRVTEYATQPVSIRKARTMLTDRDGGLWMGTTGEGLFHSHRGRVDQLTHADGLSSDTVFVFFEDREGNVWAGTERGLDRFWDLPVTTLSKREGLTSDAVISVYASREGGVWLGSGAGLDRVSANGEIRNVQSGSGSTGSLFEDRTGTLWMDSQRGLAILGKAGPQWVAPHQGLQTLAIGAAAEDDKGTLWFSDVDRGLLRVEDRRVVESIPWSRFDNKRVSALEVNPVTGDLLMGFYQGGVAEMAPDGTVRRSAAGDGLGSGAVTDLHFDRDGTAWIAAQGGLSRWREGRISTLAPGILPCQPIHALTEDNDGNLWLNTACGLVSIGREDLAAWSKDQTIKMYPTLFGARDGMRVRANKGGYFRGAAKSKDGRLWFVTFDGVAVVDPRHLPYNPFPPPVEIESVLADQAFHTVRSGLELPHISQGLQIDYTAFSFVDPERVRFKYKLDGYDTGWIDAASRRQALYPSLPPGNYHFQVIASNNDGVWNTAGASLDFHVAPMYYQTAWFRLMTAALVLGLVWIAYRLRVKSIEATLSMRFEERLSERTRISRDLHDTLLQNISGFALELEGLSKIVTAPLSAKEHLRELRRQAEAWLREARETVSNLRTHAPEEHDLVPSISKIGEEVSKGGIQFRVSTRGTVREVAAVTRQNLLRIVQEAVRNAAAHSHASEIGVLVSYPGKDRICIEISDNGCGFDLDAASQKTGHWGLTTMRERARELGAELQIASSPARGSKIEIRAPLTPPSEQASDDRQAHSNPHR